MSSAIVSRVGGDSPSKELPNLRRRPRDGAVLANAIQMGFHPVLARVIAQRKISASDLSGVIQPSLDRLSDERAMADMEVAAHRLATAVITGEVVGVETDYDMDGLGAHAAFVTTLVDDWNVPANRIRSYIGHRLHDGYGLSDPLAKRILSERPNLVITADNGSSDEPRLARLKAAGIDVIVTDHHEYMHEAPPASALAFVNPQRPGCAFEDKAIAGGMVMWLLLRAARRVLWDAGYFAREPRMPVHTLDFVACSTIADCVSIASPNNRAVVDAGLHQMNRMDRLCWEHFGRLLKCVRFTADSIAFGIAPHINARTRLADPYAALHLLLAKDYQAARSACEVLRAENDARKQIERAMVKVLLERAETSLARGTRSLCMLLPDGHPGVQGICSSRLVEQYGRPSIVFSPVHGSDTVITGSARSVDRLHMQRTLKRVDDLAGGGLIRKFGGHKAAAGATINKCDFDRFSELFEQAVSEQLSEEDVGPVIVSDGELTASELSLLTFRELQRMEPTGRGFERAVFDGEFVVSNVRAIGDGTHASMTLTRDDAALRGVWFRARNGKDALLPIASGERAHLVYSLAENDFRGRRSLELRVEGRCQPC